MQKHVHPDPFQDEHTVSRVHPVDEMERIIKPFDAVRDSRVKCVRLINAFASIIEAALADPNATLKSVATAFWKPVYGMGLNICDGISPTDRALLIGVARATISKGAIEFVIGQDLEPSEYMRDPDAQKAYREARNKRVRTGKNKEAYE